MNHFLTTMGSPAASPLDTAAPCRPARVRTSGWPQRRPLWRACLLGLCCLAAGPWPVQAQAQAPSPEEAAQRIAALHNATVGTRLGEGTVSSSAMAFGKNVQIINVLRMDPALSPAALRRFSDDARATLVQRTCALHKDSAPFRQGLSYTFEFRSEGGDTLTRFDVDREVCATTP